MVTVHNTSTRYGHQNASNTRRTWKNAWVQGKVSSRRPWEYCFRMSQINQYLRGSRQQLDPPMGSCSGPMSQSSARHIGAAAGWNYMVCEPNMPLAQGINGLVWSSGLSFDLFSFASYVATSLLQCTIARMKEDENKWQEIEEELPRQDGHILFWTVK